MNSTAVLMLGNCGVISIIVSLDAKLDYDEISVIVCRRNRMKYVDVIPRYYISKQPFCFWTESRKRNFLSLSKCKCRILKFLW